MGYRDEDDREAFADYQAEMASQEKADVVPTLGACRVNAADYDGQIVVEEFGFWNGSKCWAVPAWGEGGEPDLAGPFTTTADEAQEALWDAEGRWNTGCEREHFPSLESSAPNWDTPSW